MSILIKNKPETPKIGWNYAADLHQFLAVSPSPPMPLHPEKKRHDYCLQKIKKPQETEWPVKVFPFVRILVATDQKNTTIVRLPSLISSSFVGCVLCNVVGVSEKVVKNSYCAKVTRSWKELKENVIQCWCVRRIF